jgi:hypothetical protein
VQADLERIKANEEEVKKRKNNNERFKMYETVKPMIGAVEGEKFDVKRKPEFQKSIKEFCASTRKTIRLMCHFANKKKIAKVEIEVPHAFDLSERFKVWYKAFCASGKYSFLFGSLEAGDCNVAKAIGDWKIRFSGACE